MNQRFNKNQILAQQILEKMGNSDEFLTEVEQEIKPSRIENRRERTMKHQQKVAKRNKNFQDWND